MKTNKLKTQPQPQAKLVRELKISRDTIKAIRGLIVDMEEKNLPSSTTIDMVKLVLENDESLMKGNTKKT
jgi:hypothetical protein